DYNKKQPKAPRIEIDRNFNPFKNEGSPSSSKPKFTGNQKAEQWESLYTGLTTDDQKSDFSNLELESEAVTDELCSNEEKTNQPGIFQLEKKYIINPMKEGMLIIDQHRAHYRILYEEFLQNITVEATLSQQLLFPLVLEFSTRETK